ncbi:unnamed protein product [Owenia fusiformis]|uniref:Uncharacterized protein n=1 Tax=Owenia fusiformis TaxID=6347 RepID=A0A8J1UE39_OWEFU|nr:unnamed protein product [Owenia fusiformis]
MDIWILLSSAFSIALWGIVSSSENKMFCYYSSFAINRSGKAKFLPEHINPYLCTHIIYAFADVVDGRDLRPSAKDDVSNKGLYYRTMGLKKLNPELKVLLAVGGWFVGSKPFIPILQSDSNRLAFVANVIAYLRKYNFDGLDMDWEFPGARGSPESDKHRFTLLMKDLQDSFREESKSSGREKLLLTMATAGGMYFISKSYDPPRLIPHIDYLLLMAYNYHGSWEDRTGHHSGSHPRAQEVGPERQLNQQWTIDYWLEQGASQDKLIVGIATYGMTFTLADANQNGVNASATGGGKKGKYTKEEGILSYFEICDYMKYGMKTVWMDEQMAPYGYHNNLWVGYDNQESITYKANNIRNRGLGGAFIWSVEMDDFNGKSCNQGRYPLLSTIAEILRPQSVKTYIPRFPRPNRRTTLQPGQRTLRPTPRKVRPTKNKVRPRSRTNAIPERPKTDSQNANGVKTAKSDSADNMRELTSKKEGDPDMVTDEENGDSRISHRGGNNKYQRTRTIPTENEDDTESKQIKTGKFVCPTAGFYKDTLDCGKYYICLNMGNKYRQFHLSCPRDLRWPGLKMHSKPRSGQG